MGGRELSLRSQMNNALCGLDSSTLPALRSLIIILPSTAAHVVAKRWGEGLVAGALVDLASSWSVWRASGSLGRPSSSCLEPAWRDLGGGAWGDLGIPKLPLLGLPSSRPPMIGLLINPRGLPNHLSLAMSPQPAGSCYYYY